MSDLPEYEVHNQGTLTYSNIDEPIIFMHRLSPYCVYKERVMHSYAT
jgi:hypothetical protein